MIASHEDALICDLAEYYHIYDYEKQPPLFIATLACGLRDGSRVISELSGTTYPMETLILAGMSDTLKLLTWMQSVDGAKNRNRPAEILPTLLGKKSEKKEAVMTFSSPEEFEAARRKILNGE